MNGERFGHFKERAGFVLAVALTTAWVIVVALYLQRIGWAGVMGLPIGDLSSLLASAAAPIAALWLVLAVVAQRGELAEMRRRLADQAGAARSALHQAEVHGRAMVEVHAQLKRLQSGETRRLAMQDLAAQTALLAERLGVIKPDLVDMCWARFGSGDVNAFVRPFLAVAAEHGDLAPRMAEATARDATARAALFGAVRGFERVVAAIGDDPTARDLIENGPIGQANRIFAAADSATQGADPEDKLKDIARRLDAHAPSP